MKNEIIKKNLIITILSLLLFFVLSIFATSYSIRSSFEKEVVSVSQMIENQLEDESKNGKDVINSFTYNQSWLKLVYATSSGLIIINSEDDSVDSVNIIEDYKLKLLDNIEAKDRIYIEENNIYYITKLENNNILITGIEFASISIFIYEGIFFMLLIVAVVVIANIYFTRKTSDKIISAFSSINSHLKMINEGKFEEIEIKHDYEEVSVVLQEISLVYQNIYDYILQNKKEKDKIKFIIKNMNQGIIIIDENLNIELINDYAKKIFADSKDDKYYVNINELVSNEVINKIKGCFNKHSNSFFELTDDKKEKIYTYELTYQTYKHENESHKVPLLVIVITDVTKERNNDKLKQEFIANASHELKTPITSITGFSEMLLMNEDRYDDLTKKYLKIINKESSRMTSIINDMLYLSNLKQRLGEKIEVEDISLNELVKTQSISSGFIHNPNSWSYKLYSGSSLATVNSNFDAARGRRSRLNCSDEASYVPEDMFMATLPFVTQNSDFALGGDIDVSLLPPNFPNQIIFASSAGSVDDYFWKMYKEYSLHSFAGDKRYACFDIDCDLIINATYNGKICPICGKTKKS